MTARYIASVRSLSVAYIKRFYRDKTALFFTFLFPLIFLLVFGSLNRGTNSVRFDIVLIDSATTSTLGEGFRGALEETGIFTIEPAYSTLDEAKQALGRGEVDGIVELPEKFGELNQSGMPSGNALVYIEESSPQAGQTIAAIVQGVIDEFNSAATGFSPPLSVELVSTATANLSAFDYVFAGLLGFTVLSLGVFGLANTMPAEKKTGVFRRLRAAPIGSSQVILANGVAYMLNGIISLVLMFVVALAVFDFNMRGSYVSFALLALLSIILMFGIGLAIGGWAKNENQSSPVAQLVALPMMFLSGVFFPRFLMPEWMQSITGFIPLTPIVDGFRLIITEGQTLFDLGPQLAVIFAWIVAVYVIAIRVFRWE
jgi:ABC-2 type transport system permease protein